MAMSIYSSPKKSELEKFFIVFFFISLMTNKEKVITVFTLQWYFSQHH